MSNDPEIIATLANAGWFAGRTVSTDADHAALTQDGYGSGVNIGAFLREFSGLTIHFDHNDRRDTAWFGAERAVKWADRTSVAAYEERLGVKLAPVGYAHHDHLLVLASDDGRFFGTYDDFLVELGRSPTEVLRAILHGTAAPPQRG